MLSEARTVVLSLPDLRIVARYAAASARDVLSIFEQAAPDDRRPRAAVEAAQAFASGAPRTKLLRTAALAAHRAARDATTGAAREAARAAGHAAAAAYLHPLARPTQVKHILGAAAHAAFAAELAAGGDRRVGARRLNAARRRASPTLIRVLRRYPQAPVGRTRVAELLKDLETALRRSRRAKPTEI